MQQRHINRKIYFDEQRTSCRNFYLPYLQKYIQINADTCVLEIGCGEGGNLAPFAEMGCRVTGIELLDWRAKQATTFFQAEGLQGHFISANIFDIEKRDMTFDVILLHDVIEHIAEKDLLLKHIHRFLKPGGLLFIAFPAWQMPFGGHQQMCHNRILSHFPFIHLLPRFLYKLILQLTEEPPECIHEMLSIKKTRMTIENFEQKAKASNFHIIDRTLWFINPHYKQKFGLRPRHLYKAISLLPWIRNFFCTSCWYLLKDR